MRLKLEFAVLFLGTLSIYADGVRTVFSWLT